MKKETNSKKKLTGHSHSWNLKLLYDSLEDPRIEKDMRAIEKSVSDFHDKYNTPKKPYLSDPRKLLEVLRKYENLHKNIPPKPLLYLFYAKSINGSNPDIHAKMSLSSDRYARIVCKVDFFKIALGNISPKGQKRFLGDSRFSHFKYLLKCIFNDAQHNLSEKEERIMNLKRLPAQDMWVSHNEKLLGGLSVKWKGKIIPLAQAFNLIPNQKTAKERRMLALATYEAMKAVAPMSEGEINAVFTDKKINDELRGFKTPYEDTVREYRNDPAVIDLLRQTITDNFKIAHRFFKIKAKLLKQKKLYYSDRSASVGEINKKFSFTESFENLKKTFGTIDPKYSKILNNFLNNRQLDIFPKNGKQSGAYCSGSYDNPTFVMLNHVDTLRSYTTFAHEMGHAFHTELSKTQGPIYNDYSTSLAETASTLFESIALDSIFDQLSDKEKITLLHDRINNEIATVFRQIACFNFEFELHHAIRNKGFVPKEDIMDIHNRNMKAYLGPIFEMIPEDGYMFVSWSHIRRFFYVYSYAYGMLVSKALLRKYKLDKHFWNNIEIILSSGGNDTPENILKKASVDVQSAGFWMEGLKAIEDDIEKLEKLSS